jgi:hypothetical protein
MNLVEPPTKRRWGRREGGINKSINGMIYLIACKD